MNMWNRCIINVSNCYSNQMVCLDSLFSVITFHFYFFIVWQDNVDWGQNWILKLDIYIYLAVLTATMLGICGWFPESCYAIVWVFCVFLNKPCGGCLLLEAMESTLEVSILFWDVSKITAYILIHCSIHYSTTVVHLKEWIKTRERNQTLSAPEMLWMPFSPETLWFIHSAWVAVSGLVYIGGILLIVVHYGIKWVHLVMPTMISDITTNGCPLK